jgi:hypothetical protein
MMGYNKDSVGPSITVHFIGYVEASMQGYSKGSLGPSIMGYYNGYLEASMQGYSKCSLGPPQRSIITTRLGGRALG